MILKPRISGDVPYKRRWEFFAAIIAIGLGILLYLITLLIPSYSTDIIYQSIPLLFRGLFTSINDTSINNPYYPMTIFFIAFLDFPSCLAWILPGFLIGYYRNKQYYNVEIKNNGWKVFWHGAIFIELAFIILTLGLLIIFVMQFIPGVATNEIAISFLGGAILKIIFFFISPFFWISLFLAGLGGFFGTKFALNKTTTAEIVIEEVEPEAVFEEEEVAISEKLEEAEVEEPIWPEAAASKAKGKGEFEIAEINVKSLKEKIITSATASSKIVDTVECPKCGKTLPKGAKFCNNCGNKLL
ncbi:MAG: zinc ribbon domain-containing protein [Promethearchaeota archaeon]